MAYITASKLYDYIQCPHRVWREIYDPQKEKINESILKRILEYNEDDCKTTMILKDELKKL